MAKAGHKSDTPDSPVDLRQHQSEFFDEYFRKGAEFTRALLTENEALRARLAELESWARRSENTTAVKLAREYERIERDHNDLACLFVTQSQLDRVVEVREATTVITEVLLNFAGADCFALYINDAADNPMPLYAYGVERGALGEHPRITASARSGESSSEGVGRRDAGDDPLVVFPVQTKAGPFGAVSIWSFLPHKEEIAPMDRRLFEVVGWSGGGALEASRLRGQLQSTDRPDRFKALSLLLGMR